MDNFHIDGLANNVNLVEEVEILLPVKFHQNPFNGCSKDVENVSANQRPGWTFLFTDWPKKYKLGRGH